MDRTIIELGEAHRAGAVATLAAAFETDPAVRWILPDPADRTHRLPRMFDWLFDDHLAHGTILGTPDCAVVTFWRAPGKVHHHDRLWPPLVWRLLGIFGTTVLRASTVGDAIGAHVPPGEERWYLRYAGVRPDLQGKGLGGLAIREGLARASRGACLETATEANVALYLRLGFRVVEEWDVPRGGPHFWTMVAEGTAA